jgi:hypothetical protein
MQCPQVMDRWMDRWMGITTIFSTNGILDRMYNKTHFNTIKAYINKQIL